MSVMEYADAYVTRIETCEAIFISPMNVTKNFPFASYCPKKQCVVHKSDFFLKNDAS